MAAAAVMPVSTTSWPTIHKMTGVQCALVVRVAGTPGKTPLCASRVRQAKPLEAASVLRFEIVQRRRVSTVNLALSPTCVAPCFAHRVRPARSPIRAAHAAKNARLECFRMPRQSHRARRAVTECSAQQRGRSGVRRAKSEDTQTMLRAFMRVRLAREARTLRATYHRA